MRRLLRQIYISWQKSFTNSINNKKFILMFPVKVPSMICKVKIYKKKVEPIDKWIRFFTDDVAAAKNQPGGILFIFNARVGNFMTLIRSQTRWKTCSLVIILGLGSFHFSVKSILPYLDLVDIWTSRLVKTFSTWPGDLFRNFWNIIRCCSIIVLD